MAAGLVASTFPTNSSPLPFQLMDVDFIHYLGLSVELPVRKPLTCFSRHFRRQSRLSRVELFQPSLIGLSSEPKGQLRETEHPASHVP